MRAKTKMKMSGSTMIDQKKAYLGRWLWLPKHCVSLTMLQRSLTFDERPLYRETATHLGIPRNYLNEMDLLEFDIVDQRPKEFAPIEAKSKITLRHNQIEPVRTLSKSFDGILCMGCGKGKTVMMLHTAVQRGYPTLVLNDKIHILNQWREEMIGSDTRNAKLDIDPDRIGLIRGKPDTWKWKNCDFVLASLRTLGRYTDYLESNRELQNNFGTIIWDEVHHAAAPDYLPSAHTFPGLRLGVTATVYRTDGLHHAYFAHIGPILYKDVEHSTKPRCIFVESPLRINMSHPDVRAEIETCKGDIHYKKWARYLGTRKKEIEFVSKLIQDGYDRGRTILALSGSREHVELLHKIHKNSCALHAGVPEKERLKALAHSRLIFGTSDMAAEALDKSDLDTLVILVEFTNLNGLQQSVGRTLRRKKGKKVPLVITIHHRHIPYSRRKAQIMWDIFQGWGFECLDR